MRRRQRLTFFFLLASACALGILAACGAGDLSGLTTGRRDASTDSIVLQDGGTAGDTPTTSSACTATFCDGFDEEPLGAKWSGTLLTGGATVSLVEGGVSPPYALRAAWPGGVANTRGLLEKFLGSRREVRCELDLQVLSPPATGEVDYIAFVAGTSQTAIYRVYLAIFDSTWNLAEYAILLDGGKIDRARDISAAPPVDRWTHVRFEITATSASIAFDGVEVATLASLSQFDQTSRAIHVGITFASAATTGGAALYDNIACDYGL